MHYVAVFRVAAEYVGDYLAECFGEYAFVDIFDGCVDILFRGRHATAHISLVAHNVRL